MRIYEPADAFLGPLHRTLLAFPISLFTFALFTDIAYLKTAEIQWTNFSAWLITGALVFGAVTLLLSLVDFILGARRSRSRLGLIHLIALALAWALGLVNAFKHSQDAWSSVGAFGLILSGLCAVLVIVAGWISYSSQETIQ